jgi:hypothetical protein
VVLIELEESRVGSFLDIGQVLIENFYWLPCTIWLYSPILQLLLEPVLSLIGFNRLYDSKATWIKVMSSMLSSMTRILVTEKIELVTIF